jgi:hypothetical protein
MPGPPGGIQLASGRLVVGIYGADAAGNTRSYAGYSDDHGKTWAHGTPAGTYNPAGPVYGGGENQIVTYGDNGTLAMFLRGRTLLPTDKLRGPTDVSHNHGLAWSASWSNASRLNLTGSYCEGSAVTTADGGLLLSAPTTFNGGRYNLTLWSLAPGASTSGGSIDFQYYATVDGGGASYSSMLRGRRHDEIINLYERGPGGYTASALTFARFTFTSGCW